MHAWLSYLTLIATCYNRILMWRSSGSRRGALVLFVVTPLVILTVLDCTFAPPIRSTHYGIPGKLQAGRIEVGG